MKVNLMRPLHRETHLIRRIGWLRAAVLGANDGIISTASLLVGVAAGARSGSEVLLAGVAGLVAGATSMAAGEYVSVSSQADTEEADIARERRELVEQPESELEELTRIYVNRGVEPTLARQVSQQMMAKDALSTHMRDELGFAEHIMARPIQAALTSAATFASGAALPLIAAVLAPTGRITRWFPRCLSSALPPWEQSAHAPAELKSLAPRFALRFVVPSRWRPRPS
jgi:VIT1/CCC1 family predicted Fe2+/Mn2+ transporter